MHSGPRLAEATPDAVLMHWPSDRALFLKTRMSGLAAFQTPSLESRRSAPLRDLPLRRPGSIAERCRRRLRSAVSLRGFALELRNRKIGRLGRGGVGHHDPWNVRAARRALIDPAVMLLAVAVALDGGPAAEDEESVLVLLPPVELAGPREHVGRHDFASSDGIF